MKRNIEIHKRGTQERYRHRQGYLKREIDKDKKEIEKER